MKPIKRKYKPTIVCDKCHKSIGKTKPSYKKSRGNRIQVLALQTLQYRICHICHGCRVKEKDTGISRVCRRVQRQGNATRGNAKGTAYITD